MAAFFVTKISAPVLLELIRDLHDLRKRTKCQIGILIAPIVEGSNISSVTVTLPSHFGNAVIKIFKKHELRYVNSGIMDSLLTAYKDDDLLHRMKEIGKGEAVIAGL